MAQQVKVIAAKPDDLSSKPLMVDREDQPQQVLL